MSRFLWFTVYICYTNRASFPVRQGHGLAQQGVPAASWLALDSGIDAA